MDNSIRENPITTVLSVIFIIVIIVILPNLFLALAEVIKAIGVAIGLGVSIFFGTIAISGIVESWVLTVGAYGLTGIGVGTSVWIVAKIGIEVAKKPYEWLLPLLGVIAGFLVDLSKEFYTGTLTKIIFATISGLLVVVAGVLFKLEGVLYKMLAIVLLLFPPLFVLISSLLSQESNDLVTALNHVPWTTWILIVALVIIAIVIMVLADKSNSEKGIVQNTRKLG